MATRTVKEVALAFETDGRTLRKFLRSTTPKDEQPGKGNRWSIEAKDVRKLRKGFDAWVAAKAEKADEVLEDEDTDAIEDEVPEEDTEDNEDEDTESE